MCTFQTSITPWKNNARAALTLSFDGGYTTTYNLAMEVLLKYKMPATWFIVTGFIGGSLQGRPVVNWEELKKISSDMEIGSHTITHPKLAVPFRRQFLQYVRSSITKAWKFFTPNGATKLRKAVSNAYKQTQGVDYTKVLSEAVESKAIIEHRLKIQGAVISFAYPGGRYNSKLKKGIKEAGYLSARSTEGGYNFPDSLDFYALKSKVWNVTVNAERANRWVDDVIKKGAWLIETYHVISGDGATGYHYDTAVLDLDAHLGYVASKNIWVDTQGSILKYVKERNVTKIKLDIVSIEKIVLLVENDLDPNIYDQPLTLKTTVPTSWSRVKIEQAGNTQEVLPLKENNKLYVYYNILPNKGKITITPL